MSSRKERRSARFERWRERREITDSPNAWSSVGTTSPTAGRTCRGQAIEVGCGRVSEVGCCLALSVWSSSTSCS